VLRDALMWQVGNLAEPGQEVSHTRAFLAALKEWHGPDSTYHRDLRDTAVHAMTINDDYLAHEFLETDNEPQTFAQFMGECAAAKLAFLGEGETWMQIADNFDAQTRDLLRNMSGNFVLPMEQSIDILTCRTFRQTLLIHASREAEIKRLIEPSRLEGLHFLGPLSEVAAASPAAPDAMAFVGLGGRRLTTSSPAVQRAFRAIAAKAPSSISHDELLAAAASSEADGEEERANVADGLLKAVLGGVIEIRSAPVAAAGAIASRPERRRLGRNRGRECAARVDRA
jgi:hypothetical protein